MFCSSDQESLTFLVLQGNLILKLQEQLREFAARDSCAEKNTASAMSENGAVGNWGDEALHKELRDKLHALELQCKAYEDAQRAWNAEKDTLARELAVLKKEKDEVADTTLTETASAETAKLRALALALHGSICRIPTQPYTPEAPPVAQTSTGNPNSSAGSKKKSNNKNKQPQVMEISREESVDELVERLQTSGISAANEIFSEVERLKEELKAMKNEMAAIDSGMQQLRNEQQANMADVAGSRSDVDKLSDLVVSLHRAITNSTTNKAPERSVEDLCATLLPSGVSTAQGLYQELDKRGKKLKDLEFRQQYLDLNGSERERLEAQVESTSKQAAAAAEDAEAFRKLAQNLHAAICKDKKVTTTSPGAGSKKVVSSPKGPNNATEQLVQRLKDEGVSTADALHAELEKLRKLARDKVAEVEKLRGDLVGTAVCLFQC